jgi:Mn2+/Fe2+ NRAMP family transporter
VPINQHTYKKRGKNGSKMIILRSETVRNVLQTPKAFAKSCSKSKDLQYFIFHIKSLFCAIPALIYSSKTQVSIKKGDLQAAKKYSRRTFQCNLASNVFALVIFLSTIGIILALTLSRSRENSNFNGNTTQIYSKTTTSRKF